MLFEHWKREARSGELLIPLRKTNKTNSFYELFWLVLLI